MSKYEIILENYQGSVEKHYFAILELMRDFGFKTIKTKDNFNSSITSSFWGNIEQRRTMQQEKASQFMGLIANMVKTMFQIIRTIRISEMRLDLYTQSEKGPDNKSAEIALKGIWVDIVEGAGKNPSSVYGLAAQVGFTTLPDLFFDVTVRNAKEIEKAAKTLEENGLNRKVIEVLRRKLTQYIKWRNRTEIELKTSKVFNLAYLRQHFNTIRIYLNWVKPYLENVKRLNQNPSRGEDMLEMADTAIADIELFGFQDNQDNPDNFKKWIPTVTATFEYRTVPDMVFHQEYQKGPIHVGNTKIILEGKPMLIDEIREKFRDDILEDINIIKDINASISAFDTELIKYLKEAEEVDPEGKLGLKLKKGKVQPPNSLIKLFGPFTDIGKGFKKIFGSFKSKETKSEQLAMITYDLPADIKKMWDTYQKNLSMIRGKRKRIFKLRENFATDKEFKNYISMIKKTNTNDEENELAKVKGLVNKTDDLVWKIYDTFKKPIGAIRW